MNEPPDQTAELRAANLLSFGGMIGAEVLLDELRVLAQAGVHVEEDHALLLEVLLQRVVDDLGLVLGADAGEELLLGLGDAEPVEGVLDVGRHVVPGLALLLGRLQVVEDVLEVDLAEVAAPRGHRARAEVLERLQAEVPHPLRLVLVLGDLRDDLGIQATLRLEDGDLWIVEAVLVVVADAGNDLGLGRRHQVNTSDCFGQEGVVALRLELVGELRTAALDDSAVDDDVDEVGLDVVEDALVVRDHEHALSGLASLRTPSATTLSASMSSPESVSSRTAMRGFSIAICRISARFFSPPEKPSFR